MNNKKFLAAVAVFSVLVGIPAIGQVVSGGTVSVTATNLSTNIAQMNGAAVTMGNGASGTGVQRVTIANDSTGIVGLAAGTQVIGHVICDSGCSSSSSPSYGAAFSSTGTPIGMTDGTNMVAFKQVANGANTTGASIVAAGLMAQCDDTSPVAVTENSFANLRLDCTYHSLRVMSVDVNGTPADFTANASTNLKQLNGTTVDTNSGNKSAGTQRVILATDQVAVAGLGVGATGSAPPANAIYNGANGSGATGGLLAGLKTCDSHAIYDASDNGNLKMVTGVSGRKIYVCGYVMATGSTATNLKFTEGTGTNCGTGTANVTPAFQLVANDRVGFSSAFWNGMATATAADDLCINASAGNTHQVELWYTIQ